jgi:hypothetical protein
MEKNKIDLAWAHLMIDVERTLSETKEEYIRKRYIAEKDEDGNLIKDNAVELGYHWKVCQDILTDSDYRRKFEHCLSLYVA